jgi:hypothetical protein
MGEMNVAKSLRGSMNPDKFLVSESFDFNDLEGSYNKKCKKEFSDSARRKESVIWNEKAREYFRKMLDEVFGSPPNIRVK